MSKRELAVTTAVVTAVTCAVVAALCVWVLLHPAVLAAWLIAIG